VIGGRRAIALVARREIVERGRERTFVVSTLVSLLLLSGIVLLPSLLGFGGPTKGEVAAAGPDAQRLVAQADRSPDVDVTLRRARSDGEARTLVRDGDADAAVVDGGRALVADEGADEDLLSALQGASLSERAGALPPPLPVQRAGGGDRDEERAIAYIALIVLYLQLIGYGYWVAAGVVEEKSTRVVELLLSTIRARELLAGKILGIGLLGFGQLVAIGVAGLGVAAATGEVEVTGALVGALAIVLAWFVLGYAFYSCAFAAAAALVQRQEDLQSATAPLTLAMMAGFLLSFSALQDPESGLAQVLCFIPPSAPMVMPVRVIQGGAAAWEVVAAILVTLAGVAALVVLAGRIYSRAVLRTGGRVRLTAALREAE
jgi:ABC-2 type transport system permease protein